MSKNTELYKEGVINHMKKLFPEITKAEAAKILHMFTHTIENALSKGKEVKIIGFGTFGINKIPARQGRNPQDGAPMLINEHFQVKFRAGERLKAACKKIGKPIKSSSIKK